MASGFEPTNARRLEPLLYMLKESGRLSKDYPQAIRERAAAWCSQIDPILSRPSHPDFAQLLMVRDIDPGEALLLAAAAERPGSLVATGDRRACRALKAAEGLEALRAGLQGKLVCLETALWLLLEHKGFPDLVRVLTQVRKYNRTLSVLLSQGELTPEENFREGLASYWRELQAELGDLLFRPSAAEAS